MVVKYVVYYFCETQPMPPKQSGMTLVETILTAAIVGVLAAAIGIIIFSHKKAYLTIASKKIKTDIEYARDLAMTKKGSVFGVFFNAASNTYTVYEGSTANPVKDPLTKQSLIENFSKFGGVRITGNNYTVEFNAFGSPAVGGGGSVRITDGSVTKTIMVIIETGKVVIQ